MTTLEQDRLLRSVRDAIVEAMDATRAMEQTVRLLKDAVAHYSWVGVYVLEGDVLVLGPFVGKPSPHTRIPVGQGICGAAAAERATIVVEDVKADARYLACSLETQSEIVVPIMRDGRVLGEIDIDSDRPAAFDAADRGLLEAVAALLADRLSESSPAGQTR
ncbi:MAG TPA: GAF domain-containing protein [Vicinamibacterales bacterium]|nr:GAF domain-containing protein [Vicinamibacterales bacterium]